jgi:uncharacterized protein
MVKVQFEHRSIIDPLCASLHLPISEYCFSNIYLFRDVHAFELHDLGNGLYALTGLSYARNTFLMPLYHPPDWDVCLEIAKKFAAQYIYPVPEEWWYECPQFSIQSLDEESDYVVETDTIRSYKGRHFDGHRYNVRKFLDSVSVQIRPLEGDAIRDAQSVVHEWQQLQKKPEQLSDVGPCLEALNHMEVLGLKGYVFYANGLPCGMIIGQALRGDMFVFHFAKAVSASLGLYQYMYQYFAQNITESYRFLNWEQDLGLIGLRKAKTSFHPLKMIKKGRIFQPA